MDTDIVADTESYYLTEEPFWTTIYIAGPMTGRDNFNYDTFNSVAESLRTYGFMNVNNPAEHFEGEQGLSWTVYLTRALDAVVESKALVLLPGWDSSVGARLEVAVGASIGAHLYDAVGTPGDFRFIYRTIDDPRVFVAGVLGMAASSDTSEMESSELPHEEAERLVHGPRQSSYGHPLDNFKATADMWNGTLHYKLKSDAEVTPEDVALMMAQVKIARHVNVPKRDNLVDAHGYLMTYVMVEEERKRRAEKS